jgi:hypothetical protein
MKELTVEDGGGAGCGVEVDLAEINLGSVR